MSYHYATTPWFGSPCHKCLVVALDNLVGEGKTRMSLFMPSCQVMYSLDTPSFNAGNGPISSPILTLPNSPPVCSFSLQCMTLQNPQCISCRKEQVENCCRSRPVCCFGVDSVSFWCLVLVAPKEAKQGIQRQLLISKIPVN